MTTTLKLNSIAFTYEHQPVLNDISLTVKTGQIACLLGPSGCGKSTLLRLIAGFEKPQAGEIYIADHLVANQQQATSPQNRQVGMLFQDLALFPHLTVAENITFGLHKLNKNKQQQRVDELLELCCLQAFSSRYPHQLSGGQCQRVALARAMAPRPKLILLDEPFSSVETGLQSQLVHEVKTMLQADNSTALWVTHSLDEAFAVADQMGVMLGGQLLQWSKPNKLYENPEHPDVIRFLNHANLISCQINENGQSESSLGQFELENHQQFKHGDQVKTGINKRSIYINESEAFNATVINSVYQGGQYLVVATLSNGDAVEFFNQDNIETGHRICLKARVNQPIKSFKTN